MFTKAKGQVGATILLANRAQIAPGGHYAHSLVDDRMAAVIGLDRQESKEGHAGREAPRATCQLDPNRPGR